jgi:[ribosomal protein S5]-alanine N-acetyltransferase
VIIETERLRLREIEPGRDDAFVLELLNDPGFIANIGDRGARDLVGANRYIVDGPARSYREHGFGLWLAELKATREPIGICGLVKRQGLADPDIGYALLARFAGRGYATEAAAATLTFARKTLGLSKIVAITTPSNAGSIAVLRKIGLSPAGFIRLPGQAADSAYFT